LKNFKNSNNKIEILFVK